MRLTYLFISGLAMTAMMSSCSSENDAVTTDNGNGLKTISLNFSAANLKTRATGDPADASKYIVGPKSTEARLSRLAVGIFNGTATSSINELTPDNTTLANAATYTASFNAQAAANYNVYIVANAPVGHFSGKTTLANFEATALDLGYTTSDDGNTNYTSGTTTKQVQTALPMNCTLSTLTAVTSGVDKDKLVVTSGIAMKRLVARIGISSIKINIPATGMYADDTFTPTEVFVYNAATSVNPDGTTLTPEPSSTGESTTPKGTSTALTAPPTMADNLGNYSYLSTGLISSFTDNTQTTPTPTLSTTNQYYFYVFPHTATNPTKLVIKGTWYNSTAKTYEIVYYPIVINHAQIGTTIKDGNGTTLTPTEAKIDANMQYNLTAEIKAKGVSDPGTDITPSAISVGLTVTNWDVTNQDVIFE
jgi:hypothetical protein